jgi:hypothetical protein
MAFARSFEALVDFFTEWRSLHPGAVRRRLAGRVRSGAVPTGQCEPRFRPARVGAICPVVRLGAVGQSEWYAGSVLSDRVLSVLELVYLSGQGVVVCGIPSAAGRPDSAPTRAVVLAPCTSFA